MAESNSGFDFSKEFDRNMQGEESQYREDPDDFNAAGSGPAAESPAGDAGGERFPADGEGQFSSPFDAVPGTGIPAGEAAEAGYSGESEAVGDAFSGNEPACLPAGEGPSFSGQEPEPYGESPEGVFLPDGDEVPVPGADAAVQPAESGTVPVSFEEPPAAGQAGEKAVYNVEPAPVSSGSFMPAEEPLEPVDQAGGGPAGTGSFTDGQPERAAEVSADAGYVPDAQVPSGGGGPYYPPEDAGSSEGTVPYDSGDAGYDGGNAFSGEAFPGMQFQQDGYGGEPSGQPPEMSDSGIPQNYQRDPQAFADDGMAAGGWDAPGGMQDGYPAGGFAAGPDGGWQVAGMPSSDSGSGFSSLGNSSLGMNSAYDGAEGDGGWSSSGMPDGQDGPVHQMSQEEAINSAEASEKKPVGDTHRNMAQFLNRNMLLMAIAGAFVVVILFFTVILPILKPSGRKQKATEFAAAGGVVPKEISEIPDGVAVAVTEPEPEPEPEPEEEDFSSMFPDPSEPTGVDYTYDYTVPGGTYAEEYDSSADVQQVGFSDVELSDDQTALALKSKIAGENASEAQQLIQAYQKKVLDNTWMPYRPVEGYEDVSALASSAAMDSSSLSAASAASAAGGLGGEGGGLESLYAQMLAGRSGNGSGPAYPYDQQNAQSNKTQFRQAQTAAGNYKYNGSTTLWKGTIIPAVLETAINTDLPGMVVATVTQNIYSSYDGKYLLIPQGSKVFAQYNSSISYNQGRVQIAWETLIRPDGLEIELGRLDGVDSQGHSGVPGHVSRHPFEYAKAMALIALFSVVNTKMVNTVNGYGKGKGENGEDLTNNYYENLYSDMQGQANQIGGLMITRALDIQPTITIDSGTKVNLITNATMVLPPLQADKPTHKYVRKE